MHQRWFAPAVAGPVALDFVAKTAKSGFDDIYTSLKLRIIQCGGGFMFSPVYLPLTLNAFKDYAAEHDYGVKRAVSHSTNTVSLQRTWRTRAI